MKLAITIDRNVGESPCPLKNVFKGLERVKAVKSIFGEKTGEVLNGTKLVLQERKGYLHVDDKTGNIVISTPYLKNGDEKYLYLDVIHELVHVRQHMDGKELFDRRYNYVDRPTEKEAYAVAVREAKRIGMKYGEIVDYLRVDWVSEEEFKRMLVNLGLGPDVR